MKFHPVPYITHNLTNSLSRSTWQLNSSHSVAINQCKHNTSIRTTQMLTAYQQDSLEKEKKIKLSTYPPKNKNTNTRICTCMIEWSKIATGQCIELMIDQDLLFACPWNYPKSIKCWNEQHQSSVNEASIPGICKDFVVTHTHINRLP